LDPKSGVTPAEIMARRRELKEAITSYSPESRVTRFDVIRPWIAVAIGFVIFCVWLRACSTGGRLFF
jgi:hypothetical protein